MMEHYGVAVFGFVLGAFVFFWSWLSMESEVRDINGGSFKGMGSFRYFIASLGMVVTILAMIFVKYIYYP